MRRLQCVICIFTLLCAADGAWAFRIGINPSSVADYSSQLVFVDLFRQSRPWMSGHADGSGPFETQTRVPLRPDGYPSFSPFVVGNGPKLVAHTLMAREIQGRYPIGDYTFSFEGDGEIKLAFDAEEKVYSKPGRYKVRVSPSQSGVRLVLNRSNPANPVRDIRFVMPGLENAADPFYPLFMQGLKPFRVIRFMDMQATNNSPLGKWSERRLPVATQTGQAGVALEILIDMVNRTDADPWFCIPHSADDDFVLNFARMLKGNLRSGKRIYLEYSNEVWNSIFTQNRYAINAGVALGLDRDPYIAGIKYGVKRSLEIFDIVEKVLGDGNRLVRVISSQAANPGLGEIVVKSLADPLVNPRKVRPDALAIAPYAGHSVADDIARQGLKNSIWPDEIVLLLEKDLAVLGKKVREYAKTAEKAKLELMAYEAGQHLAANDPKLRDDEEFTFKLIEANRSRRMKDLYLKLFRMWEENGGSDMMLFAYVGLPNKYGSWGLLEWTGQPEQEAFKYAAVGEYLRQTGK